MSSDECSNKIYFYSAPYLKKFVQSQNSSHSKNTSNNKDIIFKDDAKESYENIIGTEGFIEENKSVRKVKHEIIKHKSCTSINDSKQKFNFNHFMKSCESNNTTAVSEILGKNKDMCINLTDEFGWTPLMSACCAGAKDVVQLLLRWNSNITIRNRKGETCLDLAKSKGHLSVVQLLNEYKKHNNFIPESKSFNKTSPNKMKFYCETCKQSIEDFSHSKHESSLTHLFNSAQRSSVPTMYGIPESNKGFQILLRSGWDKEKGLGPDGTGHKFPPKTVLKQDKTGLGAREYKARVTHLLDEDNQKPKSKHSVRRNIKKEKRNEKRLERKLRQMLS